MRIEVLGPGCARCEKLAAVVEEAVANLALDAEVIKVTDIREISARGVLMTPALVVDGEVRSSGKVLTVARVRELLVPGA